MPATVSPVVKQLHQDWTRQLEPDAIRGARHDIGYQWRQRLLDPVVIIQLFFVQILHGNTACTHLRHPAKLTVTASAYCQARMKLPLHVFQRVLRGLGDCLQHKPLDEGRWLGHRTFWADGSSFSMPETPALQNHFGQPGGQRPGCGFPVAHLMTLFHAGTGMVLRVLAAPLCTHDMSQVVELHPELHPSDVLVSDRGFCSADPFQSFGKHMLNHAPNQCVDIHRFPLDALAIVRMGVIGDQLAIIPIDPLNRGR